VCFEQEGPLVPVFWVEHRHFIFAHRVCTRLLIRGNLCPKGG
jgi:hypothetical protein